MAVGVTRTCIDPIFILPTSPRSPRKPIPFPIPRLIQRGSQRNTKKDSINQAKGTKKSALNEENATVVEILSFAL
jgi:hypothetical protein